MTTTDERRAIEEGGAFPFLRRRPSPELLADVAPPGGPGLAHPGALPNFSGADNDERLMELWLRDKATETKRQYVQDLERFFDFSG